MIRGAVVHHGVRGRLCAMRAVLVLGGVVSVVRPTFVSFAGVVSLAGPGWAWMGLGFRAVNF